MNLYHLQNVKDLPRAEQNAIYALVRAGVDINPIKSIEHCSLTDEYRIITKDEHDRKSLYKIARDFSTCITERLYKPKKKRVEKPRSAAWMRAEACFNI